MAAGWAVAFDTPYEWTKQVASDHGGTKVGMAIHWPEGIKAKGELRT
jgi:arylsulfatase A-like enzyme